MGQEKESSYYDDYFTQEREFHLHYKESYYYVHWTQVIVLLRKIPSPQILEIGCGTGQLAEYLRDEGYTQYSGFDFSTTAIEMAERRVNMNFFLGDALDSNTYLKEPFNTIICLEVLEHIDKDLEVIKNIPMGTHIIFSVPNFEAPSHVRWFSSEREIKRRYFRLVDFKQIVRVGNIYICRGTVSSFNPMALQAFLCTRENIGLDSFTKRLRFHFKRLFR